VEFRLGCDIYSKPQGIWTCKRDATTTTVPKTTWKCYCHFKLLFRFQSAPIPLSGKEPSSPLLLELPSTIADFHAPFIQNIVRRRYWSLMTHGYDPEDPENEDWRIHVDHCIEYLRLGITCGDFLVVEPDSPPGTPVELTVDGLGWGVTHECINFERLLAWQKEQELLYVESWQNQS
jgi:Mycotoxin biosynthesis protein UstYa